MSDDDQRRAEETAEPDSVWYAVGQHAGWGLMIAASIGFFLWLGLLADRRFGTLPILTILGALLGAAAGFYSMITKLIAPREGESGVGGDGRASGGEGP